MGNKRKIIGKGQAAATSEIREKVPFAYIRARDGNNRRIWAVIAAVPERQAAITGAVNNAKASHERVDVAKLVEAFNGEITRSGKGDVPDDVKEAFELLYNDQGTRNNKGTNTAEKESSATVDRPVIDIG